MRAFVVEELGRPGSVKEIEDPKPEAGEILVRVRAAGVNPFDRAVVQGWIVDHMEHRFPLVPGGEFSGEVVDPGDSGLQAGAEVYGSVDRSWLGAGSWAELATLRASSVAPKPSNVEHSGAASLVTAGLTGLAGVEAAGVSEGDTLLVVGATGGTGSFAVQIAAMRGVNVIAVGRGENEGVARSLGAADFIDYTAGDIVEQAKARHPDGVDALFDAYSDDTALTKLAEAVKEGGAVVSPKGAADPESIAATGRKGANANRPKLDRLADMNEWLESGRLKVPPTKTFPLDQANEALEEIGGGHVVGKLVLLID